MSDIFTTGSNLNKRISVAVTTYNTQSYYTHACLEAIRAWKNSQIELIVACHDQSLLLEFYLKACHRDGLIDKLFFTPSRYGHTRGVNLCFEAASGDYFFNICNDMLIGDFIVADCATKLQDESLGLIGWHWYCDGERWREDGTLDYHLREENKPFLAPQHEHNIRQAAWFTGKTFEGIGGPKWIQLCNTSFFGIRKQLWKQLGGFDFEKYPHLFADDFLGYAVLDQGLNVLHFEQKFRRRPFFAEFDRDNQDAPDRRRNADRIDLPLALEAYTCDLEGGLSVPERQLLYQIAKSLGPNKTVLHVGVWRGAGLILFIKGLEGQPTSFIGIDCFDEPGVSNYSQQPPVSLREVVGYVSPCLDEQHTLQFIQANTLRMTDFPRADVIFVDAGHTKECIEHDIELVKHAVTPDGILIFHDYGQPRWPDIKTALDAAFGPGRIRRFGTLAVIQN